jgi:carboxypeptidase Taq
MTGLETHPMTYDALCDRLRNLFELKSARSVLEWDQETMMPERGAPLRARQLAALAGLTHEQFCDAETGRLLDRINDEELDSVGRVVVAETRRDYERARRVPASLVRELTETCSLAHQAWIKARANRNPADFYPWLEKLLDLKRAEVEFRAPSVQPYDEMLSDFERGLTGERVHQLFEEFKAWAIPFVRAIKNSARRPDRSPLTQTYSISAQERMAREVIRAMGFDFSAGRMDLAAHPFCGGTGPFDVRLTNRFDENDVLSSFFSALHEAGHGLYEQGLNPEHMGLPVGEAASMAIHESQSRLWENFIGRSRAFWRCWFPRFQANFGAQTAGLDEDDFYFALNAVEPSLIRVEADEVTYNLHIILRTELERALVDGSLAVRELEDAWNARMVEYLGIEPAHPSEGVLQDPHWAFAGFGYFPTYTYGNLYAAQLHKSLAKDIDLTSALEAGELHGIRDWLRAKIHRKGRLEQPAQLIREVTGEDLNPQNLIAYLEGKFIPLYDLPCDPATR